ncbi:hypothetical protein PMAYCL1PPCAC_32810 [Pristionchus mayeri]|uniref:Uncharacterized protein n=1 Tax=Pristionchus mayeri TaxID=1317129 RepID=A0AAN5DGY9_9BILA|nr:hypothetical protein PMAYCL1PPCAC_32810 [Pristionchus mayeri]
MSGNFQQREPWMMMSGEKRLEDVLADQIMGANGDQAMSLLSRYAFQEMSFNRFEHQLRRDAEKEHMEKIAKLREERERRNKEEAEAKRRKIEENK